MHTHTHTRTRAHRYAATRTREQQENNVKSVLFLLLVKCWRQKGWSGRGAVEQETRCPSMQMPTRNRNKKKKEKRKSSPLPSRALTAGRAEPRTWPGRSCTCPALSSGRPPPAGAPSSPSPGRRRGWRSGSPSAGARPATAWQPCCSFCALPSTCRPAQGTQGDTNELLDVNGLGGMCSTCSPVGFAGSLPILFQCPTEARRGQALRGQQLQACRAQLHPGSAEACRYFYTTPPSSSWEWIPPRKTKAILQRYDPSHSYADLLSTSTYVCDDSQLVAQAVGINSCVALLPCATQHLGHSVCWSHPRSLSFGSFLCSELSLQHPNGFVFAHQDSKALEEDSLAQLHSQLRNGKTRTAALVPSTKRFTPWALTVKNKTFARNRSAHLWGFISQHIPKALPQKTCL